MARKARNFLPTTPLRTYHILQLDEQGKGSFTSVILLAQLHHIFSKLFGPSEERIDEELAALDKNGTGGSRALSGSQRYKAVLEKLSAETAADTDKCYYHAVEILKREIGLKFDPLIMNFINEIAERTIDELSGSISMTVDGGLKPRLTKIISEDQTRAKQSLGLPPAHRPEGSGWFRNEEDFLQAFSDVLKQFKKPPTQLPVMRALDKHSLCQQQPSTARTQSHTKLLRNWLAQSGLPSFKDALSRYFQPPKSGK